MPPSHIGTVAVDGSPYVIPHAARRRHLAIFGKSGVGKTTLMSNMIAADIAAGRGITVLDPHGQLVDDLLSRIPRHRTNEVIYFKPHDRECVPAINILQNVERDQKPLVVSALVSILKNVWPDNWGPQTEYLLTNFAYGLLDSPRPTSLTALSKLLTDKEFRREVAAGVQDPSVKDFFYTYDSVWDDDQRAAATAPLLNKVGKFATNPIIRAVVGQHTARFSFRHAMDTKKIILCDLSKGALGEDVSSLLGSLLTTTIYLSALSRTDTREDDRVPHFFYIDEVHNFTLGIDLASILSEARKYRLTMTIATQTLEQLSKKNLSSVFGNCASLMSFRVSGADAQIIEKEFSAVVDATALQDLPDFKLYIRTMSGTPLAPTTPMRVNTLRPSLPKYRATPAQIIATSRARYTRPRAQVEKNITAFLSN